jgi:hypothetical protein
VLNREIAVLCDIQATAPLHVVPANAGTHNPCRCGWKTLLRRLAASSPPVVMGPGVRQDDHGEDLRSVKPVKMMDRSMAVADAKAIGGRDRGADPGLGMANRGLQVLTPGKASRDRR